MTNFRADKIYGIKGEKLAASRLYPAHGINRASAGLVTETSKPLPLEVDERGRFLVPVDGAEADGTPRESALTHKEFDAGCDLFRIPLCHGGDLSVPVPAFVRLVRRLLRAAGDADLVRRNETDGGHLLLLPINATDLFCCTGLVGLDHALALLDERGTQTLAQMPAPKPGCYPLSPTVRVVEWDHTLGANHFWVSKPHPEHKKDYDLCVPGTDGRNMGFEVKAQRAFFATHRLYVEDRYKGRPSGYLVTRAQHFVFIFGGVTLTVPTSWLRRRVEAIVARNPRDPRRIKVGGDGGQSRGTMVAANELVCDPRLTITLSGNGGEHAVIQLREQLVQHQGPCPVTVQVNGVGELAGYFPDAALTPKLLQDLYSAVPEMVSVSWPVNEEIYGHIKTVAAKERARRTKRPRTLAGAMSDEVPF